MKYRSVFFVVAICGLLLTTSARSTDDAPILLGGRATIFAGDPWQLTLTASHLPAGERVDMVLLNGLQHITGTLTVGTGGVAHWHIPAGTITQAGQSLIIARHGEHETRRSLLVLPQIPVSVELFTTANTIPAYGEGQATLMILPHDEWGNAPRDIEIFDLQVQDMVGASEIHSFHYDGGLGRYTLVSRGEPGRLRLSLIYRDLSATLELMQSPLAPHAIDLILTPRCVLADGRDMISLAAMVSDRHDNTVTDGTLVIFAWDDGFGYGQTVDGQAVLRLPPPVVSGRFAYYAMASEAQSNIAYLDVVTDTCEAGQEAR